MNTIDENVQVGVELTVTSLQLTAKALIAIMDLFLNKNDKKNLYQNLDTKQGKQKLKDLFKKNENIEPLEKNLSKKEITEIQKELKSMGIDFSVKKIDKDDYSLFFAGKDRESIEKGMENSINKYAKREQRIDKIKNVFKENNKEQQVASVIEEGISSGNNWTVESKEKQKPSFNIKDLKEQSKKQTKNPKKEKVLERKPTHTR